MFKIVFSIIVGILLGWIMFYYSVSPAEFTHFISNTMTTYLTMDQIHGIIYPTPFFSGDARATKALTSAAFCGVEMSNDLRTQNIICINLFISNIHCNL